MEGQPGESWARLEAGAARGSALGSVTSAFRYFWELNSSWEGASLLASAAPAKALGIETSGFRHFAAASGEVRRPVPGAWPVRSRLAAPKS